MFGCTQSFTPKILVTNNDKGQGTPRPGLFGVGKEMNWSVEFKKVFLSSMTHGSLIQHLLARVSVSSERVCHALQIMHQVKSSDEAVLPISELLKPHFLSVLTFFNSQLRLPSVTLADKLQVLLRCITISFEYTLVHNYTTQILPSRKKVWFLFRHLKAIFSRNVFSLYNGINTIA